MMYDYITFADILDAFGDFFTDFLPQITNCPALIYLGAILLCMGVIKLFWDLAL